MRSLQSILSSWETPRVLVIGDLILDRYCHGTVERISPEAPIQILRVDEETQRIGGAGFCAQIARVLGANVHMFAVVGDDEAGRHVSALADQAGIRLTTQIEAGRRTSVKTRHVATSHTSSQQVLRVDRESTAPISIVAQDALLGSIEQALPESDVVLINDYGKGLLTASLLTRIIARARKANVPVIVDPYKATDFSRYAGATGITPNRPETMRASSMPVRNVKEAAAAAERLADDLDLSFVLVTLDREGMYLHERDQRSSVHVPTTPREVFDVTGAGDVVLAVLGLAMAGGATRPEAAALANVAAGIEVEHAGVVPLTRSEIAGRLAIERAREGTHENRALPLEEVTALSSQYRADGKTVVFTNGCFDILHAGHVHYLSVAKAMGDVLIVGLNSDDCVKRLKGPERPINAQGDRAAVLSALASVDYVVLFEEDTPLKLIESVSPHVLVKGMDWKDKGVIGREHVEATGGRVELVELLQGRSTTQIVNKVGERQSN